MQFIQLFIQNYNVLYNYIIMESDYYNYYAITDDIHTVSGLE